MTKVLIVGGGPAGTVAALALNNAGADVELVEIQEKFKAVGVGVNLQNSPLRALNTLGLVDDIEKLGNPTLVVNMLNDQGQPIAPPLRPESLVPGKPAAIAIGRGELAELLGNRVLEAGIKVRFETSVTTLTNKGDCVAVEFSDGSKADYDLVVGADGINSSTRSMIFGPDRFPVKYSGQAIWRASADRGEIAEYMMYNSRGKKIGLVPISKTRMYVFLVKTFEKEPERSDFGDVTQAMMQEMSDFGGEIPQVMKQIDGQVDIRALKSVMIEQDWYSGRVLLIGDAAHACTPHISYGLGMAVEDGIVLAELFQSLDSEIDEILPAFMERRYQRCLNTVNASLQLSAWEVSPPEDRSLYPRLMQGALLELDQPI
jgi:2-polyprenyl-6-methoxyphenol hydroxylase-like FAD-dependent oxidoreductase